jgi:chromosomal replication initiation ATPase DnaA
VCMYNQVSRDDLQRRCRKRKLVYTRQLCTYFLWKYTRLSCSETMVYFGYIEHTTVLHNRQTIKGWLEVKDAAVCRDINNLINLLSDVKPNPKEETLFPVRNTEGPGN